MLSWPSSAGQSSEPVPPDVLLAPPADDGAHYSAPQRVPHSRRRRRRVVSGYRRAVGRECVELYALTCAHRYVHLLTGSSLSSSCQSWASGSRSRRHMQVGQGVSTHAAVMFPSWVGLTPTVHRRHRRPQAGQQPFQRQGGPHLWQVSTSHANPAATRLSIRLAADPNGPSRSALDIFGGSQVKFDDLVAYNATIGDSA